MCVSIGVSVFLHVGVCIPAFLHVGVHIRASFVVAEANGCGVSK
jgi:hypothetical protein